MPTDGYKVWDQALARKYRAEGHARRRKQRLVPPGRPLAVSSAEIKRREELVLELSSYYDFLTTLYLPTNCIKRPPKGGNGWPFMTSERLKFLGKTDAVIDVLKHIPYVSQDLAGRSSERFQIYEKTICNNYIGAAFERAIKRRYKDEVDPFDEMLENNDIWECRLHDMQHIVVLAQSYSRDGHWIMYDTRDGQIACMDMQVGNYRSHTPNRFFDDLKEGFCGLHVFPTETTDVRLSYMISNSNMLEEIKAVFRKHRWCTPRYRKDKCMAEIKKLWDTF